MAKGRYERRLKEESMVQNMIDNGQLDLSQRFDHEKMSNLARHSLDWSLGRLQNTVDRLIKKQEARRLKNVRKIRK